jgi:23S rRNA (adenine2503-C2)-methyltransferase
VIGMRDLTGLLRQEVEQAMEELGHPRYRGRQLFQWVQARRATSLDVMTSLSRLLRGSLHGTSA